jgi:hypothetical protein
MEPLRDVRLHDQILPRAKRSVRSCDPPGHEERIHNHPCGCGSGKRYSGNSPTNSLWIFRALAKSSSCTLR